MENEKNLKKFNNEKNVFSLNVKVFLEGVEVPSYSCSVSYGINYPPSCTIMIPASSELRKLPEDTHILIVYQNPGTLPNSPWYVLFDGELSSTSYNIESNTASIVLQGVHSTAYLDYMQLICQPASAASRELANIEWAAGTSINTTLGSSADKTVLLDIIFDTDKKYGTDKSKFSSFADLIYTLLLSIISENQLKAKGITETTKFFRKKILNWYKIPQRIFGVKMTETDVEAIVDKVKRAGGGE